MQLQTSKWALHKQEVLKTAQKRPLGRLVTRPARADSRGDAHVTAAEAPASDPAASTPAAAALASDPAMDSSRPLAAPAAGDGVSQVAAAAAAAAAGEARNSADESSLLLEQQDREQQAAAMTGNDDNLLKLAAVARRYRLVSLALLCLGCVLTAWPSGFLAAALQGPIGGPKDVLFARLMGVALLFRGALALTLKAAAQHRRLQGTTAQRVMLGCMLPCVPHFFAFKTVAAEGAALWHGGLMMLYPAVLAAEFVAHLLAFQVYNPAVSMKKLLLPVAVGVAMHALAPPLPQVSVAVPRALTPVTAGAAVLLSRRSFAFAAKAAAKAMRKKLVGRAIKQLQKLVGKSPNPSPPLTGTLVGKMDFLLPETTIAWGYWFMMLSNLGVMLRAYLPDLIFAGQVTPVSWLLKQSWAAGFLAAAFASDALKTAADRQRLALQENRDLNLCLALVELGYAACLASGMASGAIVPRPYAYLQLTTALASAVFCLAVWAMTKAKGRQETPTVASIDFQAAMEERADYKKVTSAAVVVLNIATAALL